MRICLSFALFSALSGMLATPESRADCPITLDLRDQSAELPGRTSRRVRNLAGFRIATESARFVSGPESRRSGTSFELVIVPASRNRITIGGFYARRGIGNADLAGMKSLQIAFSAPKQPPSATLFVSLSENQGDGFPPRIWTYVFQTGLRLDANESPLNAPLADFRRNEKREQAEQRGKRKRSRAKGDLDPAAISAWEIGLFGEPGKIKLIIRSVSFCR